MSRRDRFEFEFDGMGIVLVVAFLMAAGGWITHIVWVIKKLSGDAGITFGQAIIGFFGVIMPPFGVVHGWMIWLGIV